jgi:hypothetical protein
VFRISKNKQAAGFGVIGVMTKSFYLGFERPKRNETFSYTAASYSLLYTGVSQVKARTPNGTSVLRSVPVAVPRST